MAGLLQKPKPQVAQGVADALQTMSGTLFGNLAPATPGQFPVTETTAFLPQTMKAPVAPDKNNPLPRPTPVYDDLNPYPDQVPAAPVNPTIPTAPENDSVESRLTGLLASDSDYIRQARAAGAATANRRGLANSSIAAGAAQGAAIERALPIATADAQIAATKNLAREDAVAQLQRLNASTTAEMTRLQTSLAGADAQQQREITAQMERLRVSTEAEKARLEQAAGFDLERLNREGQINIARDAAQATNAQDLARVQGTIQSAMQAQGNTEQIQRMGVDLANQLQVQGAQLANDLSKIAAAGDQDIRRLVEAANQERVTLQQSIAAQDRQQMAQSMVAIFQIEAQMRAALLGNTTIPASERASYERSITALGDPIRNYVNQLFGPAASPIPAPSPDGTPVVPGGGTIIDAGGGLGAIPTVSTDGSSGGNTTGLLPAVDPQTELEELRRRGGLLQ